MTTSDDPEVRSGGIWRWGFLGCLGALAGVGVLVIVAVVIVVIAIGAGNDHDDVRVPFEVGSSGTVETGNDVRVRVTLDAVTDPATTANASPEVGFHFMTISLTVENVGERETGGGNVILRMRDGFEYRDMFIPGLDTDHNYRQVLTSGGRTTSTVGFEVRDGSEIEWLKFDPRPLAKGDLYFDAE